MEKLTVAQIVEATNGVVASHVSLQDTIEHIAIDSRSIAAKGLFIAIKGETHDGHDYVAKILENANNYALVSHNYPLDLQNLIRVDDTTLALGKIAAYYRELFKIPVVAITGSNGKTTVKEMLRSICHEEFGTDAVLATSGNLNNHWGMPLTLLGLNSQHKVAIIEMGMNHAGELDYLTKLAKPTLAVVNNVMFAHAGHFTSLADIAVAKGEIYHGLQDKAVACINISNQFAGSWLRDDIKVKNIYRFGSPDSECSIVTVDHAGGHYKTSIGDIYVKLRILGRHNYDNALSAIALAINLGCSTRAIKNGLENYAGYKGRLERKTAFNGALIIDDTYNANPDSVAAALQAIQELPRPYWFIFADLKELGPNELNFHREIGKLAEQFNIDKLITVGSLSRYTAETFSGDKIHFEQNEDVVKYCTSNLPINATLLLKGSNSMRLFDVAQQLTIK